MKNIIFILLLSITAINVNAQEKLSFKKTEDSKLTHFLKYLRLHKTFKLKSLVVNVYQVGNLYAGEESDLPIDVITDNIYIAVSDLGEHPKQNAFVLADIFDARDLLITDHNNTVSLAFTYYDRKVKRRKKSTGTITLNTINLNN